MGEANLVEIVEFANTATETLKSQIEQAFGCELSDNLDDKLYTSLRDICMAANGLEDFKFDVV